jgi:hypothetical protein
MRKGLFRNIFAITLTCGLFGISGLLSVRLFFELAGDDHLAGLLLAIVAVMFEGSKVALLFWGIKRRSIGALVLTGLLEVLSLFASFASALLVVQAASISTTMQASEVVRQEAALSELKAEIASLTKARDSLPADYVSARERYEKLLVPKIELREAKLSELRKLREEASTAFAENSSSELFSAVGKLFATEAEEFGEKLRFIYLVLVAAALDIVAIAMAYFDIKEAEVIREAELVLVEVGGIVHYAKSAASKVALCGKSLEGSGVPRPGSRPCPACSMKSISLRLHESGKMMYNKAADKEATR